MSRLVGLILVLAGVLYPFAVYWGMDHASPWQFALLLGALWAARALTGKRQPGSLAIALVAMGFCVLLGVSDSHELLRWYPVLISGFMLTLFGLSLLHGMPVAERLARLTDPNLPHVAIRYTRHVTQIWCLFFLFNGVVAAGLTLWAPLSWWTLYTGVIAYCLMGVLFAGEWLVRQRVRGRA